MRVSIPGLGGSIGECVVCGQSFLTEILFGRQVQMIAVEGMSRDLPVHTKCLDILVALKNEHGGESDNWKYLPDGPLKQEYERAQRELDETAKC